MRPPSFDRLNRIGSPVSAKAQLAFAATGFDWSQAAKTRPPRGSTTSVVRKVRAGDRRRLVEAQPAVARAGDPGSLGGVPGARRG